MGLTDVIKRVAEVFTDSSAPNVIQNAAGYGARQINNQFGNVLPSLDSMEQFGDAMRSPMSIANQFGNSASARGGDMFGNIMSSSRGGNRDPFGQSMSFGGGRDMFGSLMSTTGNSNPFKIATGGAFQGGMFSSKMAEDRARMWAENSEFLGRDQSEADLSGGTLTVGETSGLSGDPSKAQHDKIKGTDQWNSMILKAAEESGVPASIIKGLMAIESGGNATIGTNTSGATGLMQVVGSIWQGTADRFGGDLNDPWTNIRTGAEILKMNKERYGTWEGAIAAYLGSPVQDDSGAWRGGTVPDAYGTTGQMYVDIAKNNISWIEQQYAESMPAADMGGAGFANAHAPNAIGAARTVLGMPYVWGGYQKETGGFDCSGLIVWAYNQAGKNMPRMVSQSMYTDLPSVNPNELKAGDLILYSFPGGQEGADHVAMYIGNGQVIQATSSTGNVTITSADWSKENIIGYRRVP